MKNTGTKSRMLAITHTESNTVDTIWRCFSESRLVIAFQATFPPATVSREAIREYRPRVTRREAMFEGWE